MKSTITIIQLLNKIANGEEVPEKIMYNNKTFRLNQITGWYQNIDVIGNVEDWFISKYRLNDEVEIIEEQEEIHIQSIKETDIEKDCNGNEYYTYLNKNNTETGYSVNYSLNDIETRKKINELVQAVKQLDKNIKEK